ncbi:hypothetical protein BC941DRAFT_442608 [Chlamydoabsidia padenii]|nr:hypothetical protein BC941DRAFT_442608 [Chlamydoabsidia padenii]
MGNYLHSLLFFHIQHLSLVANNGYAIAKATPSTPICSASHQPAFDTLLLLLKNHSPSKLY